MLRFVVLVALAGCRLHFADLSTTDDASTTIDDAPLGTPVPIQFVQTKGTWTASSGASLPLGMDLPFTPHNAVVVVLNVNDLARTLVAITDDAGNAYNVVIGPYIDNGVQFYMAVATDVATGGAAIVTATLDQAPGGAVELFVNEYSGVAKTAVVGDTSTTAGAVGTGAIDVAGSNTLTTAGAGELLVAYALGPCMAAGTGFNMRTDFHGDITEDLRVGAGQHVVTASSTCAQPTDRWQVLVAALRPQYVP